LSAIHKKLGTSEKQKTSGDALFTVETVACLGACGLAPVVVIDGQVYGAMTPERAVTLVDQIKAQESDTGPQEVVASLNGAAYAQ
jgi:NADH-quinone oxidoreductase subunit E